MTSTRRTLVCVILLAGSLAAMNCLADSAIAPKFLWSAAEPEAVKVSCDKGVTWKAEGGKFTLDFEAGQGEWPGLAIQPQDGTWDLGPWGHVEMTLTNPGAKPLSVGLRVDNPGDWRKSPWNAENVYLKPSP